MTVGEKLNAVPTVPVTVCAVMLGAGGVGDANSKTRLSAQMSRIVFLRRLSPCNYRVRICPADDTGGGDTIPLGAPVML